MPYIIILTANSSNEDKENCLNAGANSFLTNQIDIKYLGSKLHEIYDSFILSVAQ